MIRWIVAISLFLSASPVWAALKTQTLDYTYGGKTFKGYLAYDDAVAGKLPGVLVVHEFWGLNEYAKSRAEQLAKLGYVALAADLYGDGQVGKHPDEARSMMEAIRNNLPEWMGRANAALQALRAQAQVDPTRLAAIGYCFGGATVLNLAFQGADLKLVASFHGALPLPKDTKPIRARILIYHGAADSFIPEETIAQLKTALDQGKVDYLFVSYPGAKHGFTVLGSEARGIPNVAYQAEADQKSWESLKAEFVKVFGK